VPSGPGFHSYEPVYEPPAYEVPHHETPHHETRHHEVPHHEPAPDPAPGPVSEADVVAWAGGRHGWAHAQRRVSDRGYAYLVSTQDDAVLEGRAQPTAGALTVFVLKRTGEYWSVGSFPDAQAVFAATDETQFRERLPLAHLGHPEGVIGAQAVTVEQLATYLRATRSWRHLHDRITDLGWAFAVNPQPDEYLDGNTYAGRQGIGPLLVVKRNGALWHLTPTQPGAPLSEDDFVRSLAGYQTSPDEWVRR
jgi:hypothetical protein